MAIEIDIETTLEKMKSMPPITDKKIATKQEAVKLLKPGIDAMKKNNYSFEEISKFLSENGLKISPATLKNYLQKKSRTPKTPKTEG